MDDKEKQNYDKVNNLRSELFMELVKKVHSKILLEKGVSLSLILIDVLERWR